MNKPKFTYLSYLFVVLTALFSCKSQEIKKEKIRINHHSTKFLIEQLSKNEFKFNHLSTKANFEYNDGKKKSFKAHLRIKKDSAIWMSITPLLGIEMARILITKDSIKFMNRVNKEYFIGDFSYTNKHFGSDLDYQMLQALLVGNSLDFDGDAKKIKSSIDRKKGAYYISTVKKRKVRKEIKKDKGKFKKQTQALWLTPVTYKINSLLLSAPKDNKKGNRKDNKKDDKSLLVNYLNQTTVGTQLFPFKLVFTLESEIPIKIGVTYNKVNTEKTVTFPFKIPSKYVQIKK